MLVLRRREGQWVEVTHASGDVLRVRVCRIREGYPGCAGQADLVFDDDERNFSIQRPERTVQRTEQDPSRTVATG